MSSWRDFLSGKLIGGGAGLLIGGPLGALVGLVAGHAYDTWQQEQARLQDGRQQQPAGGPEAAAGRTGAKSFEELLFGDALETRRIAFATAAPTTSGVVENGASSRPAVIFVRTKPGRTTITDTPLPASASENPWANASSPALEDP